MKKKLSKKDLNILEAFATSCRHTIVSMLKQSQSGHPGGSLGCVDYLSLLYTQVIAKTSERVVVSNGHVSPAVYSVLAELGIISKHDVIKGFRKAGYPYEGHVTRHVRGVDYGTGPLGAGVSAAAGFALAEKLNKTKKHVYALIGDGESQEGQVYEMRNFATKYKLDNFVVFMDYNQVQLTDSVKNIMPLDPKKQWAAAGWHVIEVDGHSFKSMWKGLQRARGMKNKPTLLLGHTIMGKGIEMMEVDGVRFKATWHGKAPAPDMADVMLETLQAEDDQALLETLKLKAHARKTLDVFCKKSCYSPPASHFPKLHSKVRGVRAGAPTLYKPDELTDCRTAFGRALLDLAKKNTHVVALTADLSGSVKTRYVKEALPEQHIECGVAEQHMVSAAGGMSLSGFVPFATTFGVFMTSRAKDQARLNDINQTNVKMVATHCGLSVGKDGPTHQAIDDMGSMLGLFNTAVMEPADPNQCDRMIRYAASHYGNMYIRMGRHKIPVLTKENGQPYFDKKYIYTYGRTDVLRRGTDITVAASGSCVIEALRAWEVLKHKGVSAEVVIISSPKKFDNKIFASIKKTKKLITVEDHTTRSGFGSQLLQALTAKGIQATITDMLGVDSYQLSGTEHALYRAAGIDSTRIVSRVQRLLKS